MERVSFEELELSREVLKAVKEIGFEETTAIQSTAIPLIMEGRDVIGQSQTGTGKTAAFGLPAIELSDPKNVACRFWRSVPHGSLQYKPVRRLDGSPNTSGD